MLDAQLTQALDILEKVSIDVGWFVTHGSCPRQTGVMPSGSLRERPSGFQANCGLWKSDPTDPARPYFRARTVHASTCCAPLPPLTTSRAPPPAAVNSSSSRRRAPPDKG